MKSIRPIPRAALPDTMTVRAPLPDGGFGEPRMIAGVRFERTQSVSGDGHRSADAGTGTVFVDAVNSIGAFDVPAGSRVAVGEVEADAEAVAGACERWVRRYGWERHAESGGWRICGLDTTAPSFVERDGSGRFVWGFDVICTVVRSL